MKNNHDFDYMIEETLPELEGIFREILVALSNMDRIRFLKYMNRVGRITPKELKKEFFLEDCTITHHLNMLRRSGIILNDGRTGRHIYYRMNKNFLKNFMKDFFTYIGMSQLRSLNMELNHAE
jgi:predicted transcriptional regulator